MSAIEWTEEMSVGVPLLDADHKIFIGIIHALEDNMKYSARHVEVKTALNSFVQYAAYHFDREERVMAACGYPGLDDHKGEHVKFARFMNDMVSRFDRDPATGLDDEILDFVKNWLRHHILVQDMAYRPYAENNPAASAVAKAFRPFYIDAC